MRNRQSNPAPTPSQKDFLARLRKGLLAVRQSIGARVSDVARGTTYPPSRFSAVERGQALPSAKMLAVWLRRLIQLGGVVDKSLCRSILLRYRKIPPAARRAALCPAASSRK